MNKTVLMLTHDFEPIIDMKYVLPSMFNCNVMLFLENKKGILGEKKIKKTDIHTFLEIAERNIGFLPDNINKLVYLRRYYEIKDKESVVYDLISSLLHKREKPTKEDRVTLLTDTEIKEAEERINEFIPKFNYQNEYNKIIDTQELIRVYEASSGISSIVVQLVCFTSGMYFPRELLGDVFSKICEYLPFESCVTIIKGIMNANLESITIRNIIVFLVYTIIMFTISIIVFRKKMICDNK